MVIPFLLSGRFRTQTHILCSSICKRNSLSVNHTPIQLYNILPYFTYILDLISQSCIQREISKTVSHLNM